MRRFLPFALGVVFSCLALGVAIAVLYQGQSNSRIDENRESVRAAGYPASTDEVIAAHEQYEGENRAIWLLRAHESYFEPEGELSDDLFGLGLHRTDPFPEFHVEAMRTYVSENGETLNLIQQSLAYPESRFPLELNAEGDLEFPHPPKLRALTRLHVAAAKLAAVEGDSQAVAQAFEGLFSLPEALEDDPYSMSQMVRHALLGMGTFAMEQVLNRADLSEDALARLASALERNSDIQRMQFALIRERGMLLDQAERPRDLYWLFWRHPLFSDDKSVYKQQITVANFLFDVSGLRAADFVKTLESYERLIEVAELPAEQRYDRAMELEAAADAMPGRYLGASSITSGLSSMIRSDVREIARMRAAKVGVAAARYKAVHGAYPESADALVPDYLDAIPIDPYGGDPIRYRRLENGFVAYSIARNLVDEGGDENAGRGGERDGDGWVDGDITFTVERGD